MSRVTHCCLDLEGFLSTTRFPRGYVGVFRHDDGRPMSPQEARSTMFDQLRMGRKVIPVGPVCEGFSYQTGCPGHQKDAETHVAEDSGA